MKYLQINDDGYTPCGKWRVVPTEPTDAMLRNAYDNQLNYKLGVIASPTPPAELVLSGEPIGWGDSRQVSTRTSFKVMWSPKCWPEGFASPLYLHPAPDAATARDAERLREEIERLRKWIRTEGSHNDTCTRQILGEICAGCQCPHGEIDAAADRLLEGE